MWLYTMLGPVCMLGKSKKARERPRPERAQGPREPKAGPMGKAESKAQGRGRAHSKARAKRGPRPGPR